MTCGGPAIISVEYGETVDLEFTYRDDSGAPVNLSSASPSIFSATPEIIVTSGSFTITDAVNGKARFLLDRSHALSLRRGRNNRFRLQMIFGPESDDVTPDIYIQVM